MTFSPLTPSPSPTLLPCPSHDPAVTPITRNQHHPLRHPHLSLYSFPQSLMKLPSSYSNCSLKLKSSLSSLCQGFPRTLTLASRSFHRDQYLHPSRLPEQAKLPHPLSQSVSLCRNLPHVSKREISKDLCTPTLISSLSSFCASSVPCSSFFVWCF